MHVVISGYFGFDNEGDEAILQSIIHELKTLDSTINITVLSHNPRQTIDKYQVNAVNRWHINTVRRTLKEATGLISGGGSLLQDKTGMKSIPYYTGIIHLARFYKKPVFIFSQGMGPIKHPISKFLTRLALNRKIKITVRDEQSLKLLKELNIKNSMSVVPDAVFGLDVSLQESEWLKANPIEQYIAISVRPWPSIDSFKQALVQTLDRLVLEGYNIVFIPMHGEDDSKVAEDLSNHMQQPSFHVPVNTELNEKLAIIRQAEAMLGMRLHALIFSSIVNTPFGAFSYDPKIDVLTSKLKQPLLTHVEDSDQSQLQDVTLSFIKNKCNHKKQLEQETHQLKEAADRTAKLALDYFNTDETS